VTGLPTKTAGAGVLYETGVGKGGFEAWSLTPDWKHLNGVLLNDGTGGNFAPIFAPYRPNSADYVVEAQIRSLTNASNSFGVVVRADGGKGYATGVGGGWGGTTNICYLSGWWGTNDMGGCVGKGQAFDPGSEWHTYRVEIKGNTITLFIDNAVMTRVTDNRFLSAGAVGLWSNRYQLEVRNFRVMAVDAASDQSAEAEPGRQASATPLGCYADRGANAGTSGRDLHGVFAQLGDMTVEKCVTSCASKGFKYAGTQYGSQCFCGMTYGKYGKSNACSMPSAGNPDEICGGFWANSVYSTHPQEQGEGVAHPESR